jgi:hypothetical protein
MRPLIILLSVCYYFATTPAAAQGNTAFDVSKYNVIWNSPSFDAKGSMPVGNGDLGANVYAVAGDALYLLLGKTDAFDWNGNVLKTGRVRIVINPNPFDGRTYKQTLDLKYGCITISTHDVRDNNQVDIRIWIDANNPVYHVDIQGERDMDIKVEPEFWERKDGSTDRLETTGKCLTWYYTNGERSCYTKDLLYYDVPYMADRHPDPYKYNTFGCALQVSGLTAENNAFRGFGKSFAIDISSLTKQVKDVGEWKREVVALLDGYDRATAWQKHCAWWEDFWSHSWITATDNTLPTDEREKPAPPAEPGRRGEKDGGFITAQSYNVSRYMMACHGRGKYQTQFNGGIFTVPFPNYRLESKTLWSEDERDWGNRFTFQNQRLLYWPMIYSGDFETLKPFFKYYFSILDLRHEITKQWFGHEGAYFRENLQLTGAEMDDSPYSLNKPPRVEKGKPLPHGWYHNYHFNSGLELAVMGLEYYRHTGNTAFLNDTLLPLSREVILFFDKHFDRDAKGKLFISPSQVLETWWEADNPTTDVAGLRYLVAGLLDIKTITSADRKAWEKLQKELPEVALGNEAGKQFILPAARYEHYGNAENGELYAVFPFPLYGVGHGTENIVAETMARRVNKNSFDYRCWTQDQIHFAYAGMGDEAADGLVHRWSRYSKQLRFPFFGEEQPDYVPDFDHNGAGSVALQRMVVQEVGDKIYLLPAWPAKWDGSFRLHLRRNTTIEGEIKGGKLASLKVTPESRRKDVIN